MMNVVFAFIVTVAFGSCASHGGKKPDRHPISASIDVTRYIPTSEQRIGDLVVKYSDGTQEKWTNLGNCSDPNVSPSGIVACVLYPLQADGKSLVMGRDLAQNGELRIWENGKVLATVSTVNEYIEGWSFAQDRRHVVIKSREAHGPARIELFAFRNGPPEQSVGAFGDDEGALPGWAIPFHD
jgi:hypothetical protein